MAEDMVVPWRLHFSTCISSDAAEGPVMESTLLELSWSTRTVHRLGILLLLIRCTTATQQPAMSTLLSCLGSKLLLWTQAAVTKVNDPRSRDLTVHVL